MSNGLKFLALKFWVSAANLYSMCEASLRLSATSAMQQPRNVVLNSVLKFGHILVFVRI